MPDMDRMVPRVVAATDISELYTYTHIITTTPCPIDKVDAIAVLPGLGETVRLQRATALWEQNPQARHLLVAGSWDGEETQQSPTLERLQKPDVGLQRTDGVHTQVLAEHTGQQAEWLVGRIRELGITSVALVVSHWHITRGYGTLVKQMLKDKTVVPVFPVAVPTPPDAIIPEQQRTVMEMSAGEAERIRVYQEKGDVATLRELGAYASWLWRQQIVPIAQ